jgi:peroxiredoxin
MAALTPGTSAPDFTLSDMNGKLFSLHEARNRGPVVLAFFKVSCPTCLYAFPYLERIYQAHRGSNLTLVGISQNDKKDTANFLKKFGITFPVLLDDTRSYPVSNSYGLTNVPTIYWVGSAGEIEVSSVGWARQDIEQIIANADSLGTESIPVFRIGEEVADFRAG